MLLKKQNKTKQNKTNEVEESIYIEQSKENMKRGKEPTCLIDFWMQEIVKKLTALSEFGETTVAPLLNTSNVEMGSYLLDFLFDARDASTSSLLWVVTLLDSHQKVLAKVHEEVESI